MNFSEALELIKQGKSVKRATWVGKGIALHGHPYLIHKAILTGEKTLYTSELFINVFENGSYAPWTPTQSDLLKEDWEEIETIEQEEETSSGEDCEEAAEDTVDNNSLNITFNVEVGKDFNAEELAKDFIKRIQKQLIDSVKVR